MTAGYTERLAKDSTHLIVICFYIFPQYQECYIRCYRITLIRYLLLYFLPDGRILYLTMSSLIIHSCFIAHLECIVSY